MKKSQLNVNLYLAPGNKKLVGAEKIVFKVWNLPAVKTCSHGMTKICFNICYAKNEEVFYPNVLECRERNYSESLKDTFVNDFINLLMYELNRPANKGKIIMVRLHGSGDIYSIDYLNKLAAIAAAFKSDKRILFQAYTKALDLLQLVDLKQVNIKFIYSIMPDTRPEDIEAARALGLTTFEAKHISQITVNDTVCPGECGPCVKCYKGRKQQNIVVAAHGTKKNKILVNE